MSLQDKHLKQALKHAPDRDLTPSAATHEAVLAYADNALKKPRETWLTRLSNVWREWIGASWHVTGIGSAVATVLVVVIFWHELPDDLMRKVAGPSQQTQATEAADISMVDGVARSVDKRIVTKANAEKIAQKKSTEVSTPQKEKSSLSVVSQAPAPTINEVKTPTAEASVPASAHVIKDKSMEETALAGVMSHPEVAQSAPRAELGKKAISSSKLDEAFSKSTPQRSEPANLLEEINTEGGVMTANKDIQALRLRLLALDQSVQDKDVCAPSIDHPTVIDPKTRYNIETIGVCNPSTSLLREVETYNQTMRDWHAKHDNKQHGDE